MARRTKIRFVVVVLTVGFIIGVGPRPRVTQPLVGLAPPILAEGSVARPTAPTALPAWLAAQESAAGVTDTAVAKRIVFAGDSVRTPYSIVYLHGFSATRQETAPLSEQVARALGANLFETRLTGHGLPGDSLGTVTAGDWLDDAVEAMDIGRTLGDSVIVIGTSTGGTLAAWLATLPSGARTGLHTVVLIAPNFGPVDRAASVLTLPWASVLLPRLIPFRESTSGNEGRRRFWTTKYPTAALFPMQALVEDTRARTVSGYSTPTLTFYNANDRVVDALRTLAWLDRVKALGTVREERVLVTPAENEDGHVLAGRITAPSQTNGLAVRIAEFVRHTTVP